MDDSTANKTSEEFLVSGLPQITKMGGDARIRSAPKYNSLQVLNCLTPKSNRKPEQRLAPKNPRIVLNNGGNSSILYDIPSSPPTDPDHHVESDEEQNLGFLGKLRASRSGNRISSLRSSAPSVNHDALGDREECGLKHDDSTRELQHDMLARAQELNANLQEELQDYQKKSGMVAKQLAAGGQREWAEWQKEKQQRQHKDEIKKIKIDHALELNAQKEALQKASKTEIDRVKLQLMQEFNSRIFQEVTKACKKQELCIKQLNRTNRNLQEEKQGQEMDMKAYRKTAATQKEDLLRANRRVLELMQISDEQSQEIGSLQATIRSLDKTAKEVISQAERRGKDAEHTRKELEVTKKEMSYALDSASDSETGPGSSIRAWDSSLYTFKGGSEEHKLKMVTKRISTEKALVESQGCQINLSRQGILRLEQANEEDDTVMKQHRRKIRSLGESPQGSLPLTEIFDNLKAEISQLSRVEERDKVIVKQQQSGINELLVARAKLKEIQESLDQKQTKPSQAMIKLEQVETISKQQQQQQQSEINELVITKAKLKELQRCLNSKQTNLEKTMMKLGQVNRELQNLRRAQEKSNATREEPPKSYQGRCALADGLIHSERITSATSSYPYQRPFHVKKTANTLGAPKGIISSFQDVELGGRDGESKDEYDDDDHDDDDDDDYDNDDDGDDSLQNFLQKAVSRGAAIMTNLENKAERLVIASGWLGKISL